MYVDLWRNGNVSRLHREVEGSIPSRSTNNFEGPKGVSDSSGISPLFDILQINGKEYKIGWDINPIEDSYSVYYLF